MDIQFNIQEENQHHALETVLCYLWRNCRGASVLISGDSV